MIKEIFSTKGSMDDRYASILKSILSPPQEAFQFIGE